MSEPHAQLTYRPDIDGLRAVAVLAVVAYHAFPNLVTGGFVGVDVFFVISGYLITGIILKDLVKGGFSLRRFYGNRVRRIFPALSLLLLFCLGFGWFDLLVDEYHLLAKHVAGGTAFISNFILWKESVELGGYFDTAAELKPLLHLWSLGIEEQFYIFWPLLCMLSLRSVQRSRLIVLLACGLGLLSFAANLLLLERFPIMTFYFPGTRTWELMIGALLAVGESKSKVRLNWVASFVGVALIAIAVFAFAKSSPYPGWRALLPTLGSVLIIASPSRAWLNRRVLALRGMVAVGLISYPLYLWHWPLLAFLRIDAQGTPSVAARIGVVAASFLLATLTYRWLEKPLRFSVPSRRPAIITSLVLLMLAIGLSAKVVQKREVRGRLYSAAAKGPDPESLNLDVGLDKYADKVCGLDPEQQKNISFCYSDRREDPTGVVYGDSRAHAFYAGLVQASVEQQRWMLVSEPGCPPLRGYQWQTGFAEKSMAGCKQVNEAAQSMIVLNPKIKTVIIAMAARNIEQLQSEQAPGDVAVFTALVNTIENFLHAGKQVVFLGDNPSLLNPKTCLQRVFNTVPANCGIPLGQHLTQYRRYYEFVDKLRAKIPELIVYDPTAQLCANAYCSILRDGKFMYSDLDHYSDYGAKLVATDLLNRALSRFDKRSDGSSTNQ